jgi:hypothetical protein
MKNDWPIKIVRLGKERRRIVVREPKKRRQPARYPAPSEPPLPGSVLQLIMKEGEI